MIGVVSAGFSTTVLPAASAGRDFPDRHHQRVVPRRHLADHADRLAARERGVALHVLARRAPLQAARGAGEEAQVVGHHRDLVARDRLDRLARVERLQARDLLAVLLDRVGERQQRLRSAAAGVVCDQPSNAARAARTARSTSCGVEIGARASSSPVAGFSTGSVSPSERAAARRR